MGALAKAKAKGMDVEFVVHSDRSLLAFQGPKTMSVPQRLTDFDLSKLYFGMFTSMKINGADCWVTRTGYTGEDGFEISVPNADAMKLAERLESEKEVRMAALGPRDSLRLEAGLCLYGNDLNEDITPPEAGLACTIGKAPRALRLHRRRNHQKAARRPEGDSPASRRFDLHRQGCPRETALSDPRHGRQPNRRSHLRRLLSGVAKEHRLGLRRQSLRQSRHRALGRDARQAHARRDDQDAFRQHDVLQARGIDRVRALLPFARSSM